MRLFFTKGVAEHAVKILDKYTNKEFLKILLIKTVQSISAKMYIIVYYSLLGHCKEETQLVGLFFIKDVVELVVKILGKYSHKEFPKILF